MLEREALEQVLEQMPDGGFLSLHIKGQNAGLIIRRSSHQFSFQSFEVSPRTASVIETKGRLQRSFPGPAITVDEGKVLDRSFREPFAELVAKLDAETLEEACPTVVKANSKVNETRDTVHPRFVTEMLTGILRAIGQPTDIVRNFKNTRDDVPWNDAFQPWRRAPLWLIFRVALQIALGHDATNNESHFRYKAFMVFFMSRILEAALRAPIRSDLLFTMTAKIGRRLLKLEPLEETSWLQYVKTILSTAQKDLVCRWKAIENNSDPLGLQPGWNRWNGSFTGDIALTFSKLQPYILKIMSRRLSSSSQICFVPRSCCRIQQTHSYLPDLSILLGTGDRDTDIFLADLELWVQEQLSNWLAENVARQDSCSELPKIIEMYTTTAGHTYAKNPEEMSLMLLTAIELWVALDNSAVRHYPLLEDYDPGFPERVFEPLLLPKLSQMEILVEVKKYLARRRKRALHSYHFVYQKIATDYSLAIRYFEQS